MARRLTKQKKEQFLGVIRETANVRLAARACGMSRTNLYNERERDPDFAAAWDEAVEDAVDKLEAEAWRRALEGFEEPVFQRGEQVGTVRKYSDRLMERLLEANRPQKYKTRYGFDVQQNGQMRVEIVSYKDVENDDADSV